MKKLISYLAILQLFLLPIGSNFNYANASDEETEEQCEQGEVYDSSLNRCVVSKDTIDTKTAANNCEGLDGDEYKDCFNENVEKDLADAKAKGEIKEKTESEAKYGVPAVVTIGVALILWKKQEVLEQCGQTSMWLMLGGGVSSLLGEYMAQSSYKKDISGLAQKYKDKMSESPDSEERADIISSITDNQKIAFDFQIEQENARKDAHKAREKAYKLAFGLYTASALASVYDMFMGGKGCESANFSSPYINQTPVQKIALFKNNLLLNKDIFGEYYFIEELKQIEVREIVMRKLSGIFLGSANAAGEEVEVIEIIGEKVTSFSPQELATSFCDDKFDPDGMMDAGAVSSLPGFAKCIESELSPPEIKQAEVNNGESGSDDMLDKAIKSPTVRAAVAGLLAGYSKKVADDAGDLADEANDRIVLLEELKASFVSNGGAGFSGCSEEDRDDSSNTSCYCYNSDNTKNTARANFETCKAAFSSEANLAASEYGVEYDSSENGVRGCFNNSTKQFDLDCKQCKAEKDKTGKNSCYKISGKVKLGALGSLNGLKDMMKETVSFTQGNITTADLNSGNTEKLAARITKQKDKLLKNQKYAPTLKKIDKLQNKIGRQLSSRIKKGIANGSISNPFGSSLSAITAPKSAKDVLKNLEKEIKENKARFATGGTLAGGKKKSGMQDYNFGDSNNSGGKIEIDEIDSIMKKEYSFNDINNNSHNNIFKIITNRYQRSALRRLFDEKGISKADKGNDTEINQK